MVHTYSPSVYGLRENFASGEKSMTHPKGPLLLGGYAPSLAPPLIYFQFSKTLLKTTQNIQVEYW